MTCGKVGHVINQDPCAEIPEDKDHQFFLQGHSQRSISPFYTSGAEDPGLGRINVAPVGFPETLTAKDLRRLKRKWVRG